MTIRVLNRRLLATKLLIVAESDQSSLAKSPRVKQCLL